MPAAGLVAQIAPGGDPGSPSADPATWGDWPWRFRAQDASVDDEHGWAPSSPGPVTGPATPWGASAVDRPVADGAPDVSAGARAAEDQEYHFRGDSGPWTGARPGDAAGDAYRFRPLSERERTRMGDSPGWRKTEPDRAGPERSTGWRPPWSESPFRSWP